MAIVTAVSVCRGSDDVNIELLSKHWKNFVHQDMFFTSAKSV